MIVPGCLLWMNILTSWAALRPPITGYYIAQWSLKLIRSTTAAAPQWHLLWLNYWSHLITFGFWICILHSCCSIEKGINELQELLLNREVHFQATIPLLQSLTGAERLNIWGFNMYYQNYWQFYCGKFWGIHMVQNFDSLIRWLQCSSR